MKQPANLRLSDVQLFGSGSAKDSLMERLESSPDLDEEHILRQEGTWPSRAENRWVYGSS